MTRAEILPVLLDLIRLPPLQRRAAILGIPTPARRAIEEEWWWQAHGGQQQPPGNWRVWAIVAGRGFGKTRAGAEWVWARAREDREARIALVAATMDEVALVMIEGESGILNVARSGERPRWIATRGLLLFPSGAEAHAFSAERPEKLRGPQHHYAWCDELAKWPPSTGSGQGKADATWNNLMLGLRLGTRPRTIVTTTPRPVPFLKRILALPRCEETRGATRENPHLPTDYREAVESMFAGTRLGRQELEGLLLEEFEGSLWSRDLLEKARIPSAVSGEGGARSRSEWEGEGLCSSKDSFVPSEVEGRTPEAGAGRPSTSRSALRSGRTNVFTPRESTTFARVVIGLDPPASTGGDSCGIVVCGKDADGTAHVLADLTAAGLSPEAWSRRVAEAAAQFGASLIVAEKNQGGDMIASVLRAVDANLPVRLVPATRSKAARAEPIALRFETGKAKLAGHFPDLEDQLCALTWSGYQGAGSPDRADAMVWAMTELFEKERAVPRIRVL